MCVLFTCLRLFHFLTDFVFHILDMVNKYYITFVVLTFLRKGQSDDMHMVNIKLLVNATK